MQGLCLTTKLLCRSRGYFHTKSVKISHEASSDNLHVVSSFSTEDLLSSARISQGWTPNVRSQKLVINSLQYLHHNVHKMLPVPSTISVVGSTSYEQGSPGAGPDSSSARAGRDTWLELRTCPEPKGCPFSKAPSSSGMESSPSVHSWRKTK